MKIKNGFAIVCARCPDKEEKDLEATEAGYLISHTICPECKKVVLETEVYVDKILATDK